MIFFIHAPNVHQGGGLSLLNCLLDELPDTSFLTLDKRYPLNSFYKEKLTVTFFKATVFDRLKAEWYLFNNSKNADLVICMGNLPPIIKLNNKVILFLQNRYCIDDSLSLTEFGLKIRIRIIIERLWFKIGCKNIDTFVVQNKTMQTLVKNNIKRDAKIIPFMMGKTNIVKQVEENKKYDFIYIGTGEPHKNHKNLILAWIELAQAEIFPSLCLTIDSISHLSLCKWIEEKKNEYKLNVYNYGVVTREEVNDMYGNASALIFPSTIESFGLPLLEAEQYGLPIIASELDFVRDVVVPDETFDPVSPISIARSVRRFLKKPEPLLEIRNSRGFLKEVSNEI